MKKSTQLRMLGGAILLMNLWIIGQYGIEGVLVLVMTFGFAIAFELLVVRTVMSLSGKAPKTPERETIKVGAVSTEVRSSKGQPLISQSVRQADSEAPLGSDEDLWASALEELESGHRRSGLWAKAIAQSQGDESKAAGLYLQQRVEQIRLERNALRVVAEDNARIERDTLAADRDRILVAFKSGRPISVAEVKLLVAGADLIPEVVYVADRVSGNTLLHHCASLGLRSEIETLLSHGADATVSNGGAKRAHMLASTKEIQELLLAAASASSD